MLRLVFLFLVIQVLASLWDTCVAISGEFPVLILRTFRPLVVIVYISSSGFFSLWLLLFSLCPSQCIESSRCPVAVARLQTLLLLILLHNLGTSCPLNVQKR